MADCSNADGGELETFVHVAKHCRGQGGYEGHSSPGVGWGVAVSCGGYAPRYLLRSRCSVSFLGVPGLACWEASQGILRCLRGTTYLLLVYSTSSSSIHRFTTYSDADLGGNPDNSRSTGGLAPTLTCRLSSTMSEYTTVSKVGCEVMWMRYLLDEFDMIWWSRLRY